MTTTPIILSSNAEGEAGNGNSGVAGSGSISPDGTRAGFTSSASNLVAGAVTLLSDAAGAGNPSVTPDGSKLIFVSAANNLAVLA
ncbi:PD40 domain-containing protein [Rhizobium leguminosarum]|uniref:PD40 domain-containing protein n=1 Tax=Rhizobium leguminosarum TaxID=384 RepID=UPI001038A92D|nr:PD40 domain-containing protein [Rhizobium leguminosarum]NKK42530.1 hypothetical protein [Rhizobium leguminosarum bv. viciae]TCA44295.1 hypothetical protein E0H72_10790 [Rhizobium leguminosarum bv. viciae]